MMLGMLVMLVMLGMLGMLGMLVTVSLTKLASFVLCGSIFGVECALNFFKHLGFLATKQPTRSRRPHMTGGSSHRFAAIAGLKRNVRLVP